MQEALHAVRVHMNLEVAFISEIRNGCRTFRFVDEEEGAPKLHVGDSDPVELSYCQRVIDGRLPGLLHNAVENPVAAELQATFDLPVGAHLSVPIRFSDGQVYGTLCVFDRKADTSLTERDLGLMRVFGDFVGNQLEREQRRRQQRDEHRGRIQRVLDDELFSIALQPICNIEQDETVGYEALARFGAEPQQGPDRWLEDAERVGLREDLELALLKKALALLEILPDRYYISLNASPDVIRSGRFHQLLRSQPLNRVMLEVTEHAVVEDYDVLGDALSDLRADGLRLAIDDAGAGYASFRHIIRLRPNVIKLDRSLVQGVSVNSGLRALAMALIRFAEETGGKIVAEGVETEHDLDVLREIGVYKVQGYLIGRPKAIKEYDFTT
ncbi:EAL domain-containing protein [Thioalkalivibrio sp. ALMg13-2]|uniref:sensor domain-containing phosphodiesterase n=1 Tax=Thioalkalivibrio sp. ALMg13-2 TaxID=1158167 RepID=UPI000685E37C|nr:EAL domain-containing protein [Thioalkalivibrio sp. ALMg13-2]